MNTLFIEKRISINDLKYMLGKFLVQHPKITLYLAIAILLFGIVSVLVLRPTPDLNANADHVNNKYFTTITVSSGDTLWDIADEYRTVEYADAQEYIDEVKEINQIKGDEITVGCTLVIPYYAESPK